MMKRNGFTLIELMIVVAVIGILTAVALPAYNSYLARGRITGAIAALADYRVKMEQYFQDNRNYGTAGGACGVAFTLDTDTQKTFTPTCVVGSPNTSYLATLTNIAGSLGGAAGDYTYTINEANAKTTSKFKGSSVTKTCWLVKGSEC